MTCPFRNSQFVKIYNGLRITPAMVAGASDHVWTIQELLEECRRFKSNDPMTRRRGWFCAEVAENRQRAAGVTKSILYPRRLAVAVCIPRLRIQGEGCRGARGYAPAGEWDPGPAGGARMPDPLPGKATDSARDVGRRGG
jgi:hypothetical protein